MQGKSDFYTVLLPRRCKSLLQPPSSSSSSTSYDHAQARTTITMMTTTWHFTITSSRKTRIKNVMTPTYSMVQSPSWEANWFAASQEIPRISRNPTVHYCTHKRLPTASILGQSNPVHISTSYFLEIHPNIIHPPTPRSPQWSPSLRFPQQDPIHTPLLTHMRHMPSPSHSSRFYHPHNIGWGVQII
jgi:hypothetical protein